MSQLRLAIDLGTSHTVAVVRREAEPRTLLFDGSPVLPSAVFSEPPRLHVGRDAERMALIDPSRFEPHPKRRVDEGSVLLGSVEVTVVDMFVALLRRVIAEAQQTGVHIGDGVVLTCPADWGASRRNVLMQAANMAGLGPVQLVDEPVAAATYCMEVMSQQVPMGGAVLVFDFGGGTLDSSVLRREPGGLRVLSVGGLDDLGGVDIDAALVGHLGQLIQMQSPRVWQRISTPGPQSEQRERRQFWDDVRAAKEMLSRTTSAPVHVPGTDSALHLTREELERVAGPLIDRAVDETRRVLRSSGLEPHNLSGLFLVGGSSRIPLVASRLHARFGLAPVVPEQPELPVAYGGFIAGGGRKGASAGPVAPPQPAQQPHSQPPHGQAPHGQAQPVHRPQPPQHGPQPGRPAGPPMNAGPVGAPQSAPPTHHTQQVGGFPSGPVSSYAPSSGGPSSPVSSGPAFPVSGPMPPVQPAPVQQFAPPPMAQPPMTPTMTPHRPPRRSGGLRYVIIGVVAVVVLACGSGAFWAYTSIRDAFDSDSGNSGTNGVADDGKFGAAGNYKQTARTTLAGGGTLTTTVANGVVYYAAVNEGKLDIAALGPDGAEKWKKTYPVEPTDVRITATGTVLHIDCEKAATHGGKNVRLVVDAATGTEKMLRQYDNERVTHFVGNDAFIETNAGSANGRMQRLDLNTGTPKWDAIIQPQRPGLFDLLAVPMNVYAADGPTAQQGVPGPTAGLLNRAPTGPDWRQAVAADGATFVGLDAVKSIATVYDAGNGKAKTSGAVPLDGENFTAYQGVLVGQLNDKTSPGRVTMAAYGLDNFGERWRIPLPAGARVEAVRPCGPQQLCIQYTANSTYTLISMDLQTNKEAWKGNYATGDKPDWYLMKAGLVLGEWQFGNLSKPALHDPANGEKKYALDSGISNITALAGDGQWILVRTTRYLGGGKGSVSTVAAVDLSSGKMTTGVDVGSSSDQIENASVFKSVSVVVTKGRSLVVSATP